MFNQHELELTMFVPEDEILQKVDCPIVESMTVAVHLVGDVLPHLLLALVLRLEFGDGDLVFRLQCWFFFDL